MDLLAIIVATLAAGTGSVWIAALLMRFGVRTGGGGVNPQHLLSLAAGALLATAFMHLLPEAFEGGVEPSRLFAVLLFGLVFFFCSTRRSSGTTGTSTITSMSSRKVMRRSTGTSRTITATAMRTDPASAAGRC